jgi:hypothetical protein
MATASDLPVGSLLLARLFGASVFGAANVALAVTIVLLLIDACRAGTAAGLRGLRLAAATGTAGAVGLARSCSRPCYGTVIADPGRRPSTRLVGERRRPDHGHGGEALAAKLAGSAEKIRPINRSLSPIARESTRTASCPRSLSLFRARKSQAADAMPSPSGQSAVHRRGVL